MAREDFDRDDQDECECPDCAREAGRRFGCPQLTCEDCARAGCSSAEAQCGTTGAGEQANLVPDGGREDFDREDGRAIQQLPEDVDEFNEHVTESVREWVLDHRPDKETRKELLSEHAHHLVRDTESAYSRDHDSPDGVKIDSTAYVEDTYCFTCEDWVGLSGVDLRGTPRSRAEAYYLGGPPEDVRKARSKVRDELGDLAEHALLNVEHIETAQDAFAFIGEQLEQITERASEVSDGDE